MSLTRPIATALTLALTALSSLASAQGVYRIVGPDGRVSFSDQPPAAQAPATAPAGANRAGGSAALPYELRQASSRYPVTFYSAADCAPCNAGRNLLNSRGIPYTEKNRLQPGRRRGAQAPGGRGGPAVSHHRLPALEGLLRAGMDAVPGRGRLPQAIGLAQRLPPPGPLAAGGRSGPRRQDQRALAHGGHASADRSACGAAAHQPGGHSLLSRPRGRRGVRTSAS